MAKSERRSGGGRQGVEEPGQVRRGVGVINRKGGRSRRDPRVTRSPVSEKGRYVGTQGPDRRRGPDSVSSPQSVRTEVLDEPVKDRCTAVRPGLGRDPRSKEEVLRPLPYYVLVAGGRGRDSSGFTGRTPPHASVGSRVSSRSGEPQL